LWFFLIQNNFCPKSHSTYQQLWFFLIQNNQSWFKTIFVQKVTPLTNSCGSSWFKTINTAVNGNEIHNNSSFVSLFNST
jgi:hypothetical protein